MRECSRCGIEFERNGPLSKWCRDCVDVDSPQGQQIMARLREVAAMTKSGMTAAQIGKDLGIGVRRVGEVRAHAKKAGLL